MKPLPAKTEEEFLIIMDHLIDAAKSLRDDKTYFVRNSHMHKIKDEPDSDVRDAVMVALINTFAAKHRIDYGMYMIDLLPPNVELRGCALLRSPA